MSASSEKTARQKWDFGRFLKTARFYNALTPRLPFFPKLNKDKKAMNPNDLIWSNATAASKQNVQWGPLDDVVMGGVSKSSIEPGQPFQGKWTGFTSTANNGGFAGIRTKLFKTPLDCSKCTGVQMKLAGDGQRYKLILRDDADWNGIAWSYSIDTQTGKKTQVNIPFSEFKPTKFAKVLKDHKPFDKSQLTGIQLSLSKFEYDGGLNPSFKEGPFELNLDSIGTY